MILAAQSGQHDERGKRDLTGEFRPRPDADNVVVDHEPDDETSPTEEQGQPLRFAADAHDVERVAEGETEDKGKEDRHAAGTWYGSPMNAERSGLIEETQTTAKNDRSRH